MCLITMTDGKKVNTTAPRNFKNAHKELTGQLEDPDKLPTRKLATVHTRLEYGIVLEPMCTWLRTRAFLPLPQWACAIKILNSF
jgi:hypothetical protein